MKQLTYKYGWIGIFLLFAVMTEAGSLKVVSTESFSSNGPTIAGWHWLRHQGHEAEWSFACTEPRLIHAVFCFSTLSTDRDNGGAGYNSTIKVSSNTPPRTKYVTLKNDCPLLKNLPAAPGDSHGIGYSSHGCVKFPIKCLPRQPIIIKASFQRAQTAVKKDSLKMIYVEEDE